MRVLFWIALVFLVVWALRVQAKKNRMKEPGQTPEPQVEQMVSCAYCGLHFPASEAITESGIVFCSDEHRRLHSA